MAGDGRSILLGTRVRTKKILCIAYTLEARSRIDYYFAYESTNSTYTRELVIRVYYSVNSMHMHNR
jgi:hypothetical protein